MSPLNSYFLQGSPGEQRLIQDLVNEQLKMYGEDVLYLPRKIIGENTVIRENTAAKFDDSFRIEAYLMNYEGSRVQAQNSSQSLVLEIRMN